MVGFSKEEVRGVEPLSKQIVVSDDTHAFVPISLGQISNFNFPIEIRKGGRFLLF